jgi:Cys-tRNA(Pro)/Cys-tRNA(Cys) deacylase
MAGKGTPALDAVRRAGFVHRVHEYAHRPGSGAYGREAAEQLGVAEQRVLKTLLARVGGAPIVAVVPVDAELDLRALGKRASMMPAADAERTTGYVAGGISPLGQRRRIPTVVDDSALSFETVFVSAGRRGLEIELAPRDLLELTGGRAAPIASRR